MAARPFVVGPDDYAPALDMNPAERRMILVTGMMAAGKSSVAQALAELLQPSMHLRGDAFRRMIVNGREEMDAGPSVAAMAQLMLRYRASWQTARLYHAAGFHVVYQDVILGPSTPSPAGRTMVVLRRVAKRE